MLHLLEVNGWNSSYKKLKLSKVYRTTHHLMFTLSSAILFTLQCQSRTLHPLIQSIYLATKFHLRQCGGDAPH